MDRVEKLNRLHTIVMARLLGDEHFEEVGELFNDLSQSLRKHKAKQAEWQPIQTAPQKEGQLFVCRHKEKPHITFEATWFYETEERDGPHIFAPAYWSLHHWTNDEPIEGDYCDYEWMPLPSPPQALTQGDGNE